MLSRIFSGTILSIGCILVAQTAEQGFGLALEELSVALAAPGDAAPDIAEGTIDDCPAPNDGRCEFVALLTEELPPDVDAHVDCLREHGAGIHGPIGTA
ncbi:MAG: hypothetical protein GKS06_15045 [Acidobacteria bacterium]|nr:hypothetical protein [Acidobacteriota bacterium]